MAAVVFCLLIGLTIRSLFFGLIRLTGLTACCFAVLPTDALFLPIVLPMLFVLAGLTRLLTLVDGDFVLAVADDCLLIILPPIRDVIFELVRLFVLTDTCFPAVKPRPVGLLILDELLGRVEEVRLEDITLLRLTLGVAFFTELLCCDGFEAPVLVRDFIACERTVTFVVALWSFEDGRVRLAEEFLLTRWFS